jgi:hypothetical protein
VRRRFFIYFLLGLAFVAFGLIPQMFLRPGDPDADHIILRGLLPLVSSGNLFDALLALLFETLALTLLVHRVFWPLLSRILFRIQDIGTNGRRTFGYGWNWANGLVGRTTSKVDEGLSQRLWEIKLNLGLWPIW